MGSNSLKKRILKFYSEIKGERDAYLFMYSFLSSLSVSVGNLAFLNPLAVFSTLSLFTITGILWYLFWREDRNMRVLNTMFRMMSERNEKEHS